MLVAKIEIDSEILGRAVLELSGPVDESFQRIEDTYVAEHRPVYAVYKAPIEDLAAIQLLEDHGFHFVETQLRLTYKLHRHDIPASSPYRFERVTTEDQLRDVLDIASSTFTDDRYLVDPRLAKARQISSARYQAYVRQSFTRSDERVYRLVNKEREQTVAFKTHRLVNNEEALMLLGGVHPDYKNAGLAAINAYCEFNELIDKGIKRFTTHVSARNYGVMNLEIGGFQYRIKQTFIVLRKIYG
jgi:hypothetical protein